MLHIFYGRAQSYIEITDTVLRFCCDGRQFHIPADDDTRATLFSDPAYGYLKDIVVFAQHDGDPTCSVYPHSTPVELALPPGVVRPARGAAPDPSGPVEDRIARIHDWLHFVGGRITDELPEQTMVVRYLDPNAKVLEIGSNIGRNTLMIASVLADSANLVTMECDPAAVKLLRFNRAANDFNFRIEPSALSCRPLIQQGWETIPSDVILPGWNRVSTITFAELVAKHGMAFDTLVADCEGALFFILQDDPTMLDGISTVILEADYPSVENKRSVEAVFARHGLTRVHSEPLVTDWDHPFPAEVAASFFEVWTKR